MNKWELVPIHKPVPSIVKIILKDEIGGLTLSNFKMYYKAIIVKRVWY